MIGKSISHYTILEKLGEGGMGVVYKAHDTKLDRMVALKFLPERVTSNPTSKDRFLQEAKSASGLNHPNICTIFYLEDAGKESFIVMEYVDGATIRDRLAMKNIQDVVGYAVQIGEALHEAHSKGIVHRDIKADNIMLNSRNQVKVMDFGLAKIKGSIKLTRSSSTVGTLAYMAPEQVRGEDVDPRSDLFSFGVVLFEMLTGVIPFKGEHEAAVMYSLLNDAPEKVERYRSDVPPMLSNIIERCLEKDPADRYQHADDLVSELRRIQKQSVKVSRPSMDAFPASEPYRPAHSTSREIPLHADIAGLDVHSALQPEPEPKRKSRMPTVAVVAGVALLAAAGYFFLKPGEGESGQARKMLVVLPFENLGAAGEEYFADGITEEITGKLSGISGLGVIATSSARQYKKTTKSVKEIADELGVGYVLQGTIRWSPEEAGQSRVRVSPALIKVDDGTQVWSQSFNAVVSDVFTMQSDIASQVAGAMGVSLLSPEKASIGKRPTDNDEAYDLYLRGNEYYRRSYRREDMEIGIDMYGRAVEADPQFALAWARLSESHASMYWHHHDHSQRRVDLAKAAVDRALAIDPLLPEAHLSLGYFYYWCRLDYETALKELFVALKGMPNDGHLLLGIGAVQRRQGKMKEAAESMTKAIELDPRRSENLFNAAQTYNLLREYRTAEDHLTRAISLSPDLVMFYLAKARAVLYTDGSTARARQVLREASHLADFNAPEPLDMQVQLELCDGKYPEALEIVLTRIDGPFDNQFSYVPRTLMLARIHALMNEGSKAAAYCDSARIELERKIMEDPLDGRYRSSLGVALAGLGKKADAIEAGRKGMELLTVGMEAWRGTYRQADMASIYAMTGEKDSAVALLKSLLDRPSDIERKHLAIDPQWKPLRNHPGFKELIAAK